MATPSWTQTVDSLFTTTWAYRKTKAEEQAFLKTPVIFWLREAGKVERVTGHRRIEIPLEYGSNETLRWISKGDTVPIQDSELITMAYEDWKYVAVSIVRWFQDDQQNRGKAAMINYADRKINAAERVLWEEFERVVFADGSGANEPNGFGNLIAASPTTGTVHGIDRATYTWFQNQTKTSTGAAAVYLISDIRTCFNDILAYARTEIKDLFMVTDQTSFELYEDVHLEMKTLPNAKLADAGFDSVSYRGRPIMWSPSATAGYMYFVNPNYVKLYVDEEYWMQMTDWKQIPDQPNDRVAQIVCTMNMCTSRPIATKVLTTIAA